VAVPDLDEAAVMLFERFGLASVEGGRHQGHGTANRIVPLGDDYIELMSVVDRGEAETSAMGRWVDAAARDGARLHALCLRTDDIAGVAAERGLEAIAMTRLRPDGMVLSWRLAGLDRAISEPPLPFFIQWDTGHREMPGAAVAPHTCDPTGITGVELAGDPAGIRAWIGDADIPVVAASGSPGITKVTLGTSLGEIVLEGSAL
ncbi:MAG: VOC family protein, partial [Actinomycetota bacterium]